MKIAYVAGPYRTDTTDGIKANIEAAAQVAIKYWKQGYAVICPHKNTALFDGILPDQCWLDGCIALLSKCDTIVMMSNWRESSGAKAEHEFATANRIDIIYDE
jgi:hypothetical protein